ncbi:uncharacterized protein DSM5745_09780 [Aspergillus mulundensis]|uniref:Heterokaryon incompatibility domain-containing protein n=1 Tax=Aspergillus mulundensis TaxID=1810919 RepID=A0A3D8QRD4_9EURO|nr:Uncharacterized protein DSM5745_09780 [Aspergillus mulundensis]RDW64369.1 Uncharacterized protein DSM5745_09780 [Aspergillus mulundensis]
MEHLPLPAGVQPFIVAPYEASESEWFDIAQTDFLSFPSSRGWTEAQLRGGDETTKEAHLDPNGFHTKGSPQKVEQFFQTWLFFGLAIDVLKLGGVSAWVSDFLKPESHGKARIVDTSKLPEMLIQWEKGIKARGQLKKDWDTLNTMFERAGSILDRFCSPGPDEPLPLQQDKPRPWPVRDEIATTLIVMASTLRRAAYNACKAEISGTAAWPATARSTILTRRLLAKWCVADVATTLKQLSIDGHYYLAASPGLEAQELDHHAKCVRAHCRYDYDADMYVTRHFKDDRCREDVKWGWDLGGESATSWAEFITRVIGKPGAMIPIALWNGRPGAMELSSYQFNLDGAHPRPEYVAISHVWADGKGNPRANALPQCQLDRIQRLVGEIRWEGRKAMRGPPGSDGVGFWMDTLCIPVGAEWKHLRDKAITTMRRIYAEAKAVLVLDDWLQEVRSDAAPLDLMTRIYQSNWIKRLWTHQEGFLPKALWFQFKDKAVEINELSRRFHDYDASLQARGIHLGFPDGASMRLVEQYTSLRELIKGTAQTEGDKWMTYQALANVMSERKTARLADEVLCLATIISMPLDDLVKIKSDTDEKTAQARMKAFLVSLGRFETGVIFNNYPRLEERGYHWAPRSLLNFRTAQISYVAETEDSDEASFDPAHTRGLVVHYHGFIVRFTQGTSRSSFAAAERGCAIQCTSAADSGQDIEGRWFVVQLPRDNGVQWKTDFTFAVVIPEVPRIGKSVPAVVLLIWSLNGKGGIKVGEHKSVATVWVQDHPLEWVDTVRAPLLKRRTEWLVI